MTFDELSQSVYEDLNGNILTVTSKGGKYSVIFECDDWGDNDRRRRFELVFNDVVCRGVSVVEHPSGT